MRNKIIITVLLIIGLMVAIILAAAGVMFVIYIELFNSILPAAVIITFLVASFIVGTVMQKVINRIKKLWE